MKPEEFGSRRDFFMATARYALLGGMAALTVFGLRSAKRHNETCTRKGICAGCSVFATCGLPQALSAKSRIAR